MITDEEYLEIKNAIKELTENGYEVMMYHQGFGETSIFLQVLYKYKESKKKKIFAITYVPTRTELLKACDDIDEVLEVPKDLYLKLAADYLFREAYGIKDFLQLHQYKLDRSTLKSEMCEYLGISADTPYKKYHLPEIIANWDEFFSVKQLVPGRTAYIVPHALFLGKVVDDSFWEKLVFRLKDEGYTSVFNMPHETVSGIPFVYHDISVSVQLAKRCGTVIGARTGFMDIVAAFTDIPMQVIYPDDSHPSWDICKKYTWTEEVNGDYAEKYMESTGLHTLFDRPGITEHIYINDDELLDSIVNNLQ